VYSKSFLEGISRLFWKAFQGGFTSDMRGALAKYVRALLSFSHTLSCSFHGLLNYGPLGHSLCFSLCLLEMSWLEQGSQSAVVLSVI